mgnify:CR=1 FL=1
MAPSETGDRGPRVRLLRAPLAPVAVGLACGIAAGCWADLPPAAWGAVAAVAGLAAVLTVPRPNLRPIATGAALTAVAALGGLSAELRRGHVSDDDIVTYATEAPRLATVRGRILTVPRIRSSGESLEFGYKPDPKTGFILAADAVRTTEGWRQANGRLRVSLGEPAWQLRAGQQVQIAGWLSRPAGPSNPGQRDWAKLDRDRGIRAQLSAPGADGARVLAEDALRRPWNERILWNLRTAARQHLADCGDERSGAMLNALVIGERSPALAELSRTMRRTGVAHLLSISGMHLGIFLGFVYGVCRLAALTPRRSAVVVLVVLGSYLVLATPRAPLLRSVIMAVAICAAAIFRRRLSMLNALSLAAILLLVMDPLRLFRAGFQLSFGIVAGLILLHRPMRQALFGRFIRGRGLMVFRGDQRAARWLHYRAANAMMDVVAASLTAYLVAAPLVAHHFGIFSPYAPVLSILLLPLVAGVLIPGYVSLGLAWPLPNLSYQIGRLAAGAADGLAAAVNWIGHLPGASWTLRPVPAAWAAGFLAVLALVALHRRIPRGRAWVAAAVLLLAAATAWTQRTAPSPPAAELHLLDVGSGQCAVLHLPSGQTVLIDAGTRSGYDAGRAALLPFLRELRLPAPSEAFISHGDTDHYNALPPLLPPDREPGVPRLRGAWVSRYFATGGEGRRAEGPEAGEFARMMEAGDVELRRLAAGDRVRLDKRTEVEVLWPPPGRDEEIAANVNNTSLVLRVRCDGRTAMLCGDLSELGQRRLVASGADLRADVLVMPHHGGWCKALPAFVEAVDPEVLLVSDSSETDLPPTASQERRDFYTRLPSAYRFYATYRNGWIRVRFGAGGLDVRTMR